MKEQEKQEPHLLEEVSPAFLKGAGGREFLERARRRYVLRSAEAWGFLDGTGLCLRASVTGEDGTRLAPENFEGRRMEDFFSPELASSMLFYLRYALQKGTPVFRLFEYKKQGKQHTFVTTFVPSPFICDGERVLAFFTQHVSSLGDSLFIDNEHEMFRRSEIIHHVQQHRELTPWAAKELSFLGLSHEMEYLTCFLRKGENASRKSENREGKGKKGAPEGEGNTKVLPEESWKHRLSRYLLEERGLFCWNAPQGMGVLLPFPSESSPSREEQKERVTFFEEIWETLFPGERLSLGLAGSPRPLSELYQSIMECQRACRGDLFGLNDSVIHFQELGYGRLLPFSSADLRKYAEEHLAPLIPATREEGAHPEKEEKPLFLSTLRGILTAPSLTGAAKDLHVHPNTLGYRKQQVEKLLGVDLNNPHVCMNLLLALQALDFLDMEEQNP